MTSRISQTQFHIVYSPANKDDLYDKGQDLKEFIKIKSNKWLISEEYGNNNNKHWDICADLKKEIRSDNLSKQIKEYSNIEGRYEIKCYPIDKDRWNFQLGYCLKEKNNYECNFKIDEKKCLEEYEEKKEKLLKKNKNFGVNELTENYVNWLHKNKFQHCRRKWLQFLKEYNKINKVNYTTLAKVNSFALNDYCEMNECFESGDIESSDLNTPELLREGVKIVKMKKIID